MPTARHWLCNTSSTSSRERLPAVVSTGFQTLSRETIRDWVTNVGRHLDAVYSDTGLTIVSVLNGAVVLASDLLRQFERSAVQLEFVKIRRGDPAPDAGQLDPSLVTGRHVLVVEDVYDSGATLTAIVAHLRSLGPATVKTLTLLRKAGKADRTIPGLVEPDYVGFEIEDQIVAGYGLDANGRLRHLPYLASLQPAAR